MFKRFSAFTGILALAACGAAPVEDRPPDGDTRHAITGTVMAQPDANTVRLAHDAIAGYMPAMVMDIRADALPPLADGDRIRGTLIVTETGTRLTDVVVTRAAQRVASVSAPAEPHAETAALVPDVALRNQDNDIVRLRDLEGSVLVVNFIYTRCPLPDYCPRSMRQFTELRERLVARRDVWRHVRLLSATLDPAHDTPSVLRAYGEAVLQGGEDKFEQWDLVTGRAEDVARFASFAGVVYGPVSGLIQHSMESVIVGPDGRLVKRFGNGEWSLDEAIDIIARQASRAPTSRN